VFCDHCPNDLSSLPLGHLVTCPNDLFSSLSLSETFGLCPNDLWSSLSLEHLVSCTNDQGSS
jgi:hypothetical protein